MKIQLSVISVGMNADTMSGSNHECVSLIRHLHYTTVGKLFAETVCAIVAQCEYYI